MGMKVPRIIISAEYDDESALGEINITSLGYGLHQAWIFATLFGTANIFGVPLDSDGASISPVFTVSIITYSIWLLIGGLLDQKLLPLFGSRRFMVAAAGMTCVGSLLILGCGTTTGFAFALAIIAGVLTGFGSSNLILFWGIAYARGLTTSSILNTTLAMIVSVSVYILLLHFVPTLLSGIVASLLPMLSIIFLWRFTFAPHSKGRKLPVFNPLDVNRGRFAILLGVPTLMFGAALGIIRTTSISSVLPSNTATDQLSILLAAGIATILIIASSLLFRAEDQHNSLFKPLIPLIAIAVFCIPFTQGESALLPNIILLVGYMCFEALMWISFSDLSQRYRLSPIFVFGLGRGFLALGIFASGGLTKYLGEAFMSSPYGGVTTAVITIIILIAAFVIMPNDQSIKSTVKTKTYSNRNIAKKHNHESETAERDENAQGRESEEQYNFSKGGRFRRRCEAVANQFLLSRRETEILFFLAKGYNIAYLQEKLFISEGTAKTHVHHIYSKTNVHSQQELMRLIEETPDPLE